MRSPAGSFHVSNLLTYVSLALGIAALAWATEGMAAPAGAAMALAVIADTFDGAFARRFTRDDAGRAFGGQIDSLADAITFGFVPVACTAVLWSGPDGWHGTLGPVLWFSALVFAACAITRLAHFNLHHDETRGFIGVPVPVAALIWATALLASPSPRAQVVLFLACGVAMVAPLRIPRPRGFALLLFALWPAAVVAAHILR